MVQAVMALGGGAESVTAWTIDALAQKYQVTLITFLPVEAEDLNRFYGTGLQEGDFAVRRPFFPSMVARSKRFATLKDHLMMRYCKVAAKSFDVIVWVGGGADIGRRSIQYYTLAPGAALFKVLRGDPNMPSWQLMYKRWMARLWQMTSGYSNDRMKLNLSLVPSSWTGREIQQVYGMAAFKVVYPPVNSPPSSTQWELKKDSFLCVSRISQEKRLEIVIEILTRVRHKGYDLSLHIAGRSDNQGYFSRINRLCEENQDWITLHGMLSKDALQRLMCRCKYGIHGALDEPFGIGVAELVKAGCIVFVPNSGGQKEIVDTPKLTYDDIDDAVTKITDVLDQSSLRKSLLKHLDQKQKMFSTSVFRQEMQAVVQDLIAAEG